MSLSTVQASVQSALQMPFNPVAMQQSGVFTIYPTASGTVNGKFQQGLFDDSMPAGLASMV
jgi:hypothetical protein